MNKQRQCLLDSVRRRWLQLSESRQGGTRDIQWCPLPASAAADLLVHDVNPAKLPGSRMLTALAVGFSKPVILTSHALHSADCLKSDSAEEAFVVSSNIERHRLALAGY